MRLHLLTISLLASCGATPVLAQDAPPIPDARTCATVTVSRATTADIPALRQDADCFGNVEAEWDALADHSRARQASARASRRYRENRIVELEKALPPPVPAPSPTPTPTPTASGWVASPTLEGGPRLHADFPVEKGLAPAGTPLPEGDKGAFRFICAPGKLASDDPVVYPGKPGAAHLHMAWGNTDFDAFTTPESLGRSLVTGCNDTAYSLNRSLYWQPALEDEDGDVLMPNWISIYYKRWGKGTPPCTPGDPRFVGTCTGLPNQIRFIFGWDQFKPTAPVKGASWVCGSISGKSIDEVFAKGCQPGEQLIAATVAPNCWDGKHLDSPDHRSHVAYAGYDSKGRYQCPATHPFAIPQEENKAQWIVTADMIGTRSDGTRYSRVRLSSDHMLPGAAAGETLHADYMEAWVWEAKRMWEDHCIAKRLNCSAGVLGNGFKLIGASQPAYGWTNPVAKVRVAGQGQTR